MHLTFKFVCLLSNLLKNKLMGTLLFIGGAIATVALIIHADHKKHPNGYQGDDSTSNNPFSEWEEKQPYNP